MPPLNWPLSGETQLLRNLPSHTLRFSLVCCARPRLCSLQLEPLLKSVSVDRDP